MSEKTLHIEPSVIQYIARISYGKNSLKMLDVIFSRGLPCGRITTTDVWATDTIRAELPPVLKFKEMVDEWIWRKYRIEVEHLCAMRDGEKLTYEKMFYHVPKRKTTAGGGTSTGNDPRLPNLVGAVVPNEPQMQSGRACRRVSLHTGGAHRVY